jgi:hypothetical protein
MKILPVGDELLHVERHTGRRDEANRVLWKFSKKRKKFIHYQER